MLDLICIKENNIKFYNEIIDNLKNKDFIIIDTLINKKNI